jgi:hypothetical protein
MPTRMRLVLGLVVLSACSDGPCGLTRFEDAPEAGPGEVRHGFAVDATADVVASRDGVACLTCDAILYLDSALQEQRRVELDLARGGAGMIAISGDTTIVFDRDFGDEAENGEGEFRKPHFQLFALSASGDELWRNDLGEGEAWRGQVSSGGASGPGLAVPAIVAGPHTVIVYGRPLATAFDAATGQLRWETTAGPRDALAVDATGGLFAAGGSNPGSPPEATLRHLDAEGRPIWTTTWKPAEMPSFYDEIRFEDAAVTQGDELIVVGAFETATLDIGGHVLEAPTGPTGPNHANFVARLDSSGATKWAVAAGKKEYGQGYMTISKFAALEDGAAICGNYAGRGQFDLPDTGGGIRTFIARVDSDGTIAAYPINEDSVMCTGLAVTDNGSVIVVLANHSAGNRTIRVGSRTFESGSDTAYFVLNMSL